MQIDETNPADFEQETAIEPDEDVIEDDQQDEPEDLDDEAEGEADAEDDGEAEPEEEEIEYAEIELNGKKYQIPAELKDGYLMNADYTRKTQEVAEQRKANEARQAEIEQMGQVSEQEMQAKVELHSINQRIGQYQNVDWNAWQDEDPIAAQKGYIEYQQLERKAGHIGQQLQQVQNHRSELAKQDTAKRLQETREFAEKNIKGWTPEIDAKVTEFATTELGFPVETLVGAYSPPVYNTLYLAYLGAQSLKSATAKPKPQPSAQIKPLSKVGGKGNAGARKPLEEMTMDEYAAHMNKRDRKTASR